MTYGGIEYSTFGASAVLWLTGVLLLLAIAGAFIALFVCLVLHRIGRLQTESANQPHISGRELVNGALSWFGLRGAMSTLAIAAIVVLTLLLPVIVITEPNALSQIMSALQNGAQKLMEKSAYQELFNTFSTTVLWEIDSTLPTARWVALLAPTFFGLFYSLHRSLHPQREQSGGKPFSFLVFLKSALRGKGISNFDLNAAAHNLLDIFLGVGFFVSWLTLSALPEMKDQVSIAMPVIALLVFGIGTFAVWLLRWSHLKYRLDALRYVSSHFRASAWSFIVAASTLYLLLLLASLPLNNSINQRLDLIIRHGEVKVASMK